MDRDGRITQEILRGQKTNCLFTGLLVGFAIGVAVTLVALNVGC